MFVEMGLKNVALVEKIYTSTLDHYSSVKS